MAKGLGIPKRIRWKMIQRTSRDNARTPMQWSSDNEAGFTAGKPWLKINGNYRDVNVKNELEESDGVLSFWKEMIAMRKSNRVLAEGDFRPLYEGKRIYAFERALGDKSVVSVCNMSGKTVKMPRKLRSLGEPTVSSYRSSGEALRPFEFRIYEG
jgi:glycosidase